MVKVQILDEALKGGEPARLLLERSTARRISAQKALSGELSTCSSYITESRSHMIEKQRELKELKGELDMMEESLQDLKGTSVDITRRAEEATVSMKVLQEVETALKPFLKVGDALQASSSMVNMTMNELQEMKVALKEALGVCQEAEFPILKEAKNVLQERLSGISTCMKDRFLELVEIKTDCIVVETSTMSKAERKAAIVALYHEGLLEKACRAIIARFRSENVASGIRNAKEFVAVEDGNGWKWTGGREGTNNVDLLEFDLDDLDEIDEDDVDVMTGAPSMPNAAARALKIFDLLRNKLVGAEFSGILANAMQSWISSELLPPSAILSQDPSAGNASTDSLRMHIRAMSAAAYVLQTSFRLRGAPDSFKVSVNSEAIESKVGAECRAQVLLSARREIAKFAAARHSNDAFAPCPISSPNIPEESRGPAWFPFCIVSQSAVSIMKLCERVWNDAREAMPSESDVMFNTLTSAARDAMEAYGEDVPLQHSDELRGSLRLKVLFYNDCMMLGHLCQRQAGSDSFQNAPEIVGEDLRNTGVELQSIARNTLAAVSNAVQQALMENMDGACRNGTLCAYGTIVRIQRNNSLSAARNVIRELASTFSSFAPAEVAISTAANMCTIYLNRFCDELLLLDEIGEPECRILNDTLSDACENVEALMTMATNGVTSQGFVGGRSLEPVMGDLDRAQRRVSAFREVLDSRMVHIVSSFRARKYDGLIDREAIEKLIRAIFEDSPRRESSIKELDLVAEEPQAREAPAAAPSNDDDWNAGDW